MAKIKGICRNEECEMCDQIQEAEKSNFKCEKCGKDLIPFGNNISVNQMGPNKKLIALLIGIITVVLIVLAALFLGGNGKSSKSDVMESPVDSDSIKSMQKAAKNLKGSMAIIPVDSDSIKASLLAAENQRLKDSLAAVEAANAKKKETPIEKPSVAPVATPRPKLPVSSTKNLGYATFKGSWPNDVNGRMEFKSSHVIDSRDPKGRVAEPGDYVIGEWSEGHLVQGIWYGADNQVKGSVIIGK